MQTKTVGLETEGEIVRETHGEGEEGKLKIYTSVFFLRVKISAFPTSNYPLDGISNEGKRSHIAGVKNIHFLFVEATVIIAKDSQGLSKALQCQTNNTRRSSANLFPSSLNTCCNAIIFLMTLHSSILAAGSVPSWPERFTVRL